MTSLKVENDIFTQFSKVAFSRLRYPIQELEISYAKRNHNNENLQNNKLYFFFKILCAT